MRQSFNVEFLSPLSRMWMEHYVTLTRTGNIPRRSTFDPTAVPNLLSEMGIQDLSESGVSRFRLVGTSIVRRYGHDPTGRDYLDYVAPERRDTALKGLLTLARHPCGMRALGINQYDKMKSQIIEIVGFPFLRDDCAGHQVIYTAVEIDKTTFNIDDRGEATGLDVLEHRFLDIGFGIPNKLS